MRTSILALALALAAPLLAIAMMVAVMISNGNPLAFVGLIGGSLVAPLVAVILSARHLRGGNPSGRRSSMAAMILAGVWLILLTAVFFSRVSW